MSLSPLPLPIEEDLEKLRTELQSVAHGVSAHARFVEIGSRSTMLRTEIATALTAVPAGTGAPASSPARVTAAPQPLGTGPGPRIEDELEHLRTELQRILDRLDTRPRFFDLRPGVTVLRNDIAIALGIPGAAPRHTVTPRRPAR